MILRTLIILLIILMMTRPVVGGIFTYWDADNEALISAIIIDDSFSIHGKNDNSSRLDLIETTYLNILENIPDNSQLYIATLSKGEIYRGIKAKVPPINKVFELGFSSPSIDDIFKDLQLNFKNESGLKELYYITDGQEAQLESALPFHDFLSDWKIFTLMLPPLEENLSIISAIMGNEILLPNSPLKIIVEILNNGSQIVENKLIQLFIDDISVAQQLITLNANSVSTFEFITALPSTGDYSCHFKIDKDHRVEDNNFYFKISIPETLNIASISEDIGNIYMSHLFESINFKNSTISYNKYSLSQIQYAITSGNNILILMGYHLLSQAGPELLEFVGNGGHLIIFPDESDSLSLNLDIFETSYSNGNLKEFKGDNYQIANVAESAFTKRVLIEAFEKSPIKLFKYFTLPQNEKSIFITEDGYSIYARHFEGAGIIDVFSISPTLAWSNFPVRGYFIPFFHQLFYSQFSESINIHYSLDDKWDIPLKLKQAYGQLDYISPSGNDYDININDKEIYHEPIPGIHKLFSAEGNTVLFTAMNVPEKELNSTILDLNGLEKYLSANVSVINIGDGNLQRTIADSRVGSELWRFILYLITILIIIEMILSSNAINKTSSRN